MSTKRHELDCRMAAQAHLIATGVLRPRPRSSLDLAWEVAAEKAAAQARLTGLPVKIEAPVVADTGQDRSPA